MRRMGDVRTVEEIDVLSPYVPQLLRGWTQADAGDRHMRVSGTLAFVDISGFTRLTERLARKGNVGAEELSDLLSSTFADLLAESYEDGADLVKWGGARGGGPPWVRGGGAAVPRFSGGRGPPPGAARAAHRMRARLGAIGHIP